MKFAFVDIIQERMNIIFLVHKFTVGVGGFYTNGAGNYVANMAKIMTHFGHKVTVVTEAEKEEVFEWEGAEVRCIRAAPGFHDTGQPMTTFKKLIKNIWRSYWYNREVDKIDRQEKVDIVQCVSAFGIGFLREKKFPYIIRISEYAGLWRDSNKENYNFEKSLASEQIDEYTQFQAFKKADVLLAPSKLMGELVQNRIKKPVIIVESPVLTGDLESLMFLETDIETEKYFLTYGAMIYRKSIHIIARIIDDLLDEYPDMKYVVIGRDRTVPYHGTYVLASELFYSNIIRNRDRFVFMGEISDRNRLFSIVRHAYICILPTRIDNLPNTCLESMALGKVIVSSDKTSAEQLIEDGYNGFLAEIDNTEELHQKIRQAMNLSETEKELMERRAKERVKDLTPEKVYDQMMKIYSETIAAHKESVHGRWNV